MKRTTLIFAALFTAFFANACKKTEPMLKLALPPTPLNGEGGAHKTSAPAAIEQLGKRLANVERSVARHDQAILRTVDIIQRHLERTA